LGPWGLGEDAGAAAPFSRRWRGLICVFCVLRVLCARSYRCCAAAQDCDSSKT
jgi:hypothetical protein